MWQAPREGLRGTQHGPCRRAAWPFPNCRHAPAALLQEEKEGDWGEAGGEEGVDQEFFD